MRIFLSGFMAAGKTVVGRALAERLRVPFVDLDASLERRASSSVAEIFARRGEQVFRDLEDAELARVVEIDPVVVALGGGTLERAENLRAVRAAGVVVWLDTPRSTILSRLERARSERGTRPLAADTDRLLGLFEERGPTYEQCDHRLRPEDDETPARVAARIAELIVR